MELPWCFFASQRHLTFLFRGSRSTFWYWTVSFRISITLTGCPGPSLGAAPSTGTSIVGGMGGSGRRSGPWPLPIRQARGKERWETGVEEREVDRHGGHVEGRRNGWTMAMETAMEQQEANLRVGFGGVVKAVGRRSSAGY